MGKEPVVAWASLFRRLWAFIEEFKQLFNLNTWVSPRVHKECSRLVSNRANVDTTSDRWAGFTPKAPGWTPLITCPRCSGMLAVRWWHWTSRLWVSVSLSSSFLVGEAVCSCSLSLPSLLFPMTAVSLNAFTLCALFPKYCSSAWVSCRSKALF